MSDLKLDSLRIQNFRTFKDLTIDRLGRVNLIVGKNNVGKTALLEGIWMWDHPEYWHDVVSFLGRRIPVKEEKPERVIVNQRYQNLKSEFHGYPSLAEVEGVRISIGPSGSEEKSMQVTLEMSEGEEILGYNTSSPPLPFLRIISGAWEEEDSFYPGSEISISHPNESDLGYDVMESRINFVSSSGINIQDAGEFWDNAVRSNQKKSVLRALKILVPKLEDVNWVNQTSVSTWLSGDTLRLSKSSGERIPMVSFPGEDKAVPLSSLGEGTSRALWIGTSIVNSKSGILLVDEIENGLHYSVQPDLWRMIFETAQELDVQVFATTHSHDCVQAFQQVSNEHEEEGMLISLRRKRSDPEEIVAVPIEEEELEYAVETHTDVR